MEDKFIDNYGEKLNMETALPGQIVWYESPCDYNIHYGRILNIPDDRLSFRAEWYPSYDGYNGTSGMYESGRRLKDGRFSPAIFVDDETGLKQWEQAIRKSCEQRRLELASTLTTFNGDDGGIKVVDDNFIENYGAPLNHITGKHLMDLIEKAGITDPRIFEIAKDLPHFTELPTFIVPISREAMKGANIRTADEKKMAPILGRDSFLLRDRIDGTGVIKGDKPVEAMQEILEKAQKLLTFLLGNAKIPIEEPVTVRFSGNGFSMINITFFL